jgi:DNA-binding CsgD family transcriptional regulator
MVLPLVADLERAKKAAGESASRGRALDAALDAALDLLPVAAIVVDEAGQFLTSNTKAKALFGGPAIPATVLEAARARAPEDGQPSPTVVMKRQAGNSRLRIVPAGAGDGKPAIFFLVPADGAVEVPIASLVSACGLSRTEAKIVALVAQGFTNREAAERLGVSPETVRTHLRRIFDKTKTRSRAALVALAFGAAFGILPRAGVPGARE